MEDTRVVVEERHDPEALRIVLQCLREREPKMSLEKSGPRDSSIWIYQMEWTRPDSPKQLACLRITSMDRPPFKDIPREQAIEECVLMIELAIGDETTQREIDGWHADLREIAMHAAAEHEAQAGVEPSTHDFCFASAASPWSHAGAWRPGWRKSPTDYCYDPIPTLDHDRMAQALPDMPRIVLMREAKLSKKGSAKIRMTGLHGSGPFRSRCITSRLRSAARFGTSADTVRSEAPEEVDIA